MTHPDDEAIAEWQGAEASRLDLASDPVRWAKTARRWRLLGRPVPAAYAQWREAEAGLEIGVDATSHSSGSCRPPQSLDLGATQLVS